MNRLSKTKKMTNNVIIDKKQDKGNAFSVLCSDASTSDDDVDSYISEKDINIEKKETKKINTNVNSKEEKQKKNKKTASLSKDTIALVELNKDTIELNKDTIDCNKNIKEIKENEVALSDNKKSYFDTSHFSTDLNNNNNDNNDDNLDEWIPSVVKKKKYKNEVRDKMENQEREKIYGSTKELYIENVDNVDNMVDMGNDIFLNSMWTVWTHKYDCDVWTEDSYNNIYVINSIGTFWRFFNNFKLFDKTRNQLFIMRNKIKPIWEDNENRKGGICSIKMDYKGHGDLGSDVMTCISLLIMNETFIQENDEINGIAYSIKNGSVFIKIWCKNYSFDILKKLPFPLFNKLRSMITVTDNSNKYKYSKHNNKRNDYGLSIYYFEIQPEYDVNT